MSSFAKGMQMGMQAWDSAEQSKRQKVLDERAAKEFARKESDWAQADKLRGEENRAFDTMTGLQAGVYDGKQLAFPDVVTGADAGPVEAPQVGLTTPRRDATPLDYNSAMQGVAMARRDIGTLNTLQTQGRTLKEDDLIAKSITGYGQNPEQITQAMQYINKSSKALTVGKPDKDGFISASVVMPDGQALFTNLGRQDQAKLYAASELMKLNPTRALQMMGEVNKDIAAAVAQENGMSELLLRTGNDVAAKRGTLANDGLRIAETSRHNQAIEGISRGQLGVAQARENRPDLMQLFDKDGNVVLYDKRSMKPGADGTVALPTGLRMPKLPQELPESKKAGLTAYYKALGELPANTPKAQTDALAARFGVTEHVGAGGLSWGTQGEKSAPAPKKANPMASVEPMVIPFSRDSYDWYADAANRGDPMGLSVLKGWIQTNQLPAGLRQSAEKQYGK